MNVEERIAASGPTLTPAERRAAELVVTSPHHVGFGTVADVAERAGVGAATVVRLAGKLGFDGFSGLQSAIRRDMARQLRPTSERIRRPGHTTAVEEHLQLEVENVSQSLASLEGGAAEEVAALLADAPRVWVLSGDASRGIAVQAAGDLAVLRPRVAILDGNPVAMARQLADVGPGDALVVIDLRRYDAWVIEAAQAAHDAGAHVVALTDRVLSPLAHGAERAVVVAAGGAGPFDSHVGTLAALNVIVAQVAVRLQAHAAERIDRIERAWQAASLLVDDLSATRAGRGQPAGGAAAMPNSSST